MGFCLFVINSVFDAFHSCNYVVFNKCNYNVLVTLYEVNPLGYMLEKIVHL